MKVNNIKWIDKDALEAIVIIKDNEYVCEAFSCPCKLKVGDELKEPLATLDEGNVIRLEQGNLLLKKTQTTFGHEIIGEVVNIESKLITIGDIQIQVRQLPGDIKVGDIVQLFPGRIDVMD